MRRRAGQDGQVAVIAALVAFVVCGAIAIGVDYAVLTNQHRNIQAFVDESIIAGASQLNPSSTLPLQTRQLNARRTAFIYLRDNLARSSGQTPIAPATLSSCWGSTVATQFTTDVQGCPLPAPYDHYTVSICSPAETSTSGTPCSTPLGDNSVSMRVSETVATNFANLLGQPITISGGFGAAEISADANNSAGSGSAGNGSSGGSSTSGGTTSDSSGTALVKTSRFPFGLWSAGCMSIHNLLEVFAADVYVNKCSLVTQNPVGGAVCVESTPGSGGNFVFGPTAVIPSNPVPQANQNIANCTGATGGLIVSMGQVSQDTFGQYTSPPAFTPPPGYGVDPHPASWPGDAAATSACKNGTHTSSGAPASNCYTPGTYARLPDIRNNLNPGVYNILGPDPSTNPACAGTANGCPSVIFKASTMNANWADVGDRCWASPNNPATGAFTVPCPDGYITDPQSTTITDPQCNGFTTTQLGAPSFTLGATLAGSLTGTPAAITKYFVRVTQLNALGESASTESSITLTPPLQNGISVNITGPVAAGGYKIYISKAAALTQTVGNNEIFAAGAAVVGATPVTSFPATNSTPYPLFDTTACRGFGNMPSRPPAYPQPQTSNTNALENYGVTFNLYNSAAICLDDACGGTASATVLLSPFCTSLTSGNSALTPPADYGSSCFPGRNQYEADPSNGPLYTGGGWQNDGAFVIYSSSTGLIQAQDSRMHIGLTGTLYAPGMRLRATSSTTFSLVGQAFVSSLDLGTAATSLAPLIYYPCCDLATQTGNSTGGPGGSTGGGSSGMDTGSNASTGIVGAQQPAVVHLIR